ncbi:hypothetical protein ABIE44_002107 [Marmoricola sp. OAE513]|uniref:fibronectin type III domain-containing protein n=1 Tax=Marmoricola sp. OAE513 TaxID=2817894 RepID=UPI001AE89EE9
MRTRLLAALVAVAALLGTALVTLPTGTAEAAPPAGWPTGGNDWHLCNGSTYTRYCVVSAQRNGVDVTPYDTPVGNMLKPWVRGFSVGHGVGFGVDLYSSGSASDSDLGNNTDLYKLVVNVGEVRPREMDGTFRDASFLIGRYPSGDWNFTITFRPSSRHTNSSITCTLGSCGDDSTKATFDRVGWAAGAVEDLSGYPAREAINRTGSIRATSAQYENTMYDPDTDSIIVDLSNPHRKGNGDVITDGTYEAFLPNAYLVNEMSIPDPSTVSLASFAITKPGSSAATFSLVRETRGIRIKIANISYSAPRFKFRTKPTKPGKPRPYKVVKTSRTTAKVKFSAPLANGNAKIDKYQARCHKAGKPWHYKIGKGSPLKVTGLKSGKVSCQVRAHNAKGWSKYSASVKS